MNAPFHSLVISFRLMVAIGMLLTWVDCLKANETKAPHLVLEEVQVPPEWSLLQRQCLQAMAPAAEEFVESYTREDGSFIWRDAWPGMDGSDDGYEAYYNFPLYYALGGPREILDLSTRLWNAVTRQFTEYGQVYREFDAYYDWMHHGESYVNFYFFGLADPSLESFKDRSIRFGKMYDGTDPLAPNYDPKLKLIRSPINGSKGPRFVNSAEDWVTHREVLSHYPLPFPDIPNVTDSLAWVDDERFPRILETMNARMMRGDVPLNLTATSLMLNAFMATGEPSYRTWVKDYVTAWMDRMEQNNGILPDNVGLSGNIGEHMDGKWWGGYYGWRWPHGLFNQLESTLIGGMNAYLATGDASYLELPRGVLDMVEKLGRSQGNQVLVPNRHGDEGWYDYRPVRAEYLVHLWYLSRSAEDKARLARMTSGQSWSSLQYRKQKGDFGHEGYWFEFMESGYPTYPEDILRATYQETLRRLEMIRQDDSVPEERNVHHWQQRNPVVLEGLVQTMMGCPNHIYHGGLLFSTVRYFDPDKRRSGLPEDVAALVQKIDKDSATVQLVNLHPTKTREVWVQGGSFGEHVLTGVSHQGRDIPLTEELLRVRLKPGAMGAFRLGMKRFDRAPSYRMPFDVL